MAKGVRPLGRVLRLKHAGPRDRNCAPTGALPRGRTVGRGQNPCITITGFHIKIDGCVGQSFIRSYATLTISTGETADVIAYLGVTKVV